MDRNGGFDSSKIRAKMSSCASNGVHEKFANFAGQLRKLISAQRIQVSRTLNSRQDCHEISNSASCSGIPDKPLSDQTPEHVLKDSTVTVVVRLSGSVDSNHCIKLDDLLALS